MVKTSIIPSEDKIRKISEKLSYNQAKKSKGKGIRIFDIICICFVLIGVALFFVTRHTNYLILAVFFAIYFIIIKLLLRFRIHLAMKRLDPRMMNEERFYEIDEKGIRITTSFTNGMNEWSAFTDYGTLDNCIWISHVNTQIVILDKEKLSSEEIAEIEDYLKQIHNS